MARVGQSYACEPLPQLGGVGTSLRVKRRPANPLLGLSPKRRNDPTTRLVWQSSRAVAAVSAVARDEHQERTVAVLLLDERESDPGADRVGRGLLSRPLQGAQRGTRDTPRHGTPTLGRPLGRSQPGHELARLPLVDLLAVDGARTSWRLHRRCVGGGADIDGGEAGLVDEVEDDSLGLLVVAA